jgi:hypothetical protein
VIKVFLTMNLNHCQVLTIMPCRIAGIHKYVKGTHARDFIARFSHFLASL